MTNPFITLSIESLFYQKNERWICLIENIVTKTESKKAHVHIATPHPSKQAGKNSGGSSKGESSRQQQTPKSAGAFGCKTCSRTFTSEMGLQSHTKAKHSAAA